LLKKINHIFSILFLLQSIFFFYVYLISSQKADHFADAYLKSKSTFIKRLVGFSIAFGISQIVTILLYALLKLYHIYYLGQNDVLNIYHLSSRFLTTVFGFSLMYSIYISIRAYGESLQKELKLEQTRHAQTSLRYDQLSSKLDPHFLFNNLNTLHSLLPDNAQKAESFVVNLSKILRYSLQTGKDELVLLKGELEMLTEYSEIIRSRFGDSLRISFDISDASEWMLYPMTLIHLMENAIKHNEVTEKKPLEIIISEAGSHLTFKNNLNPKIQSPSIGGSLATLRELYRLKTESEIEISESEEEFAITIPLIKKDKE